MKDAIIYLLSAFEEAVGELSIMRICFSLVISVACGISIYFAVRGDISVTEIALVTGMLSCAFGAKVWQKKFENTL